MSRWRTLPLLAALAALPLAAQEPPVPAGDVERGRLVFAACRTCHEVQPRPGHGVGPNLHRIFGRVVGIAEDFAYYSESFRDAQFVWTPELVFRWLADPLGMFPDTTMMNLGIVDSQRRADLVAYLAQASVREP